MNNEEPYRDHAERLKQRIEKISERVDSKDVLPPREQINRQKKKKTKWKLKYPVIRLLVLFFILLPIIIFSVISYHNGAKKINGVAKPAEDPVGYETINLEKSTEEEEANLNPSTETNSENNESEQPSDVVEQSVTTTDNSVETDKTNETTTGTTETSTDSQKNSTVTHTVKSNENLYKIAMMYYHSKKGMDIIMKANNLKSNQINAGQVLKIPMNN
jgi:LysM repeat protein